MITVDIQGAADMVGVDTKTIRKWLRLRKFLRPLPFSYKLLWHREALEAWVRRQQEEQEAALVQ
jgi:hypothetical protein